jgi:hypothetical protein
MVRRQSNDGPLASAFVSVVEPYEASPRIASIRRLPLFAGGGDQYPDPNVAVEVALRDGGADLVIAVDVDNPLRLEPAATAERAKLVQPDWQVRLGGEMCMVRKNKNGKIERIALCRAGSVAVAELRVELNGIQEYVEIARGQEGWHAVSGPSDGVRQIVEASQ